MGHYLQSSYDLNDPALVSVLDDLPFWSAPFGMKLLEVVQIRPNIQVLDVGSGMGFPLLELSQRLGSTCRVVGIDPWRTAIDRVRLKIRVWGAGNVEIIEGKAEAMPFGDGRFDLVVSNNGINNVEDEVSALREMARVSRAGAQLVVTVNLPDTMMEFYDIFRSVLREEGKEDTLERLERHIHSKRKPLPHTQQLIREAGFTILETYEDEFSFRYVDGRTMLDNFVIKLAFLESWKGILKAADREPIFRRVEHELNHLARRTGEVRLTIPWVCINCRRAE
jgi:ubiquinone/menaquinone biosynthesis C-methylase UbiE